MPGGDARHLAMVVPITFLCNSLGAAGFIEDSSSCTKDITVLELFSETESIKPLGVDCPVLLSLPTDSSSCRNDPLDTCMSVLEQLPEAEVIELCAVAVGLGKFSLSLDCRSCNDPPDIITLTELVPDTEFTELSGPARSWDTFSARFLNNVLTIPEVKIF